MVQLYIPAISFFPLTLDHDPKYFSDPETKRTRVTSSLIGTYCWKLRFSWFLRVDFRSDLTRRRQKLIVFQKNNLASRFLKEEFGLDWEKGETLDSLWLVKNFVHYFARRFIILMKV